MTTNDWEKRIKEICTYSADEGTSGYLLSEKQFQQVFSVLRQRDLSLIAEIEGMPIEKAHSYSSENADVYRAYDNGQENFKNLIISNLRERIQ